MEDLSFTIGENYHAVDIKTHRKGESTQFHMPNLTSVKRLMDFYEKETNYFDVMMVEYDIETEGKPDIEKIIFEPVENFVWDCLRIGALGWGQLQFKDSDKIKIDRTQNRISWLKTFIEILKAYYKQESEKALQRLKYVLAFEKKINNRF